MIIIADSVRKIEFHKLILLCADEIEQTRIRRYKKYSIQQGLFQAESDFYHYLKSSFFAVGGLYFIYEHDDRYVSAVRLEPYERGVLLNSLITKLEMRRNGYAEKLLHYALAYFEKTIVYSHVHVHNKPSRALHEKMGFKLSLEYARLLDGSLCNDYLTYVKYV